MSAPLRKRLKLFTVEEIERWPTIEWLIEGIVPAGGLVVLHGPEKSGKSFVALDWALSVSTGQPWLGRSVLMGPALYVSAEGAAGLRPRIGAWKNHHGVAVDHFFSTNVAVQLLDGAAVEGLIAAALEVQAKLIVIDTLARCFVGGEENSSKEMGRLVSALDQIRTTTGAMVVPVHHDSKNGGRERGSNALTAAADVVIGVKPGLKGALTLQNKMMKDAEPFTDIHLHFRRVSAGRADDGRELDSCVLVPRSKDAMPPGPVSTPDPLSERIVAIVTGKPGTRSADLMKQVGSGFSESVTTVRRRLDVLRNAGRIRAEGNGRAQRLYPADLEGEQSNVITFPPPKARAHACASHDGEGHQAKRRGHSTCTRDADPRSSAVC